MGDHMSDALELKIPPVALVFVFSALMWFVSADSVFTVTLPSHSAFALVLFILGFTIALAGVFAFRRARTTVHPVKLEATTTMVTSGIYRFTRNPMYLGFLLVLAAWAMYLSNLLAFAFLPLFVWYITRFQIVPEERDLGVRRWL
jgi:protein-S-isoprenylcysteine O-methyltransferase Ste14